MLEILWSYLPKSASLGERFGNALVQRTPQIPRLSVHASKLIDIIEKTVILVVVFNSRLVCRSGQNHFSPQKGMNWTLNLEGM